MGYSPKNWPPPIEAEIHIKNELAAGGVQWKNSNRKNIKICCPFPHGDGNDKKFKCEITKDGHKVHCWVCDWSGNWNKLANEMGLATFDDDAIPGTFSSRVENIPVFKNLGAQLEDAVSEEAQELPEPRSAWDRGEWRGLSASFLEEVSTFLWKQESWRYVDGKRTKIVTERVGWPYHQYGDLVGYVGRRLDNDPTMKYKRASWCNAIDVLFPFDYVRDNHKASPYVVLVEGEVDALNLLSHGICCLSILGSNNWSEFKRDLILSLDKPDVVVLMDGDSAGTKAAGVLYDSLKMATTTTVIDLPAGDDPGDLSRGQINWLKNQISDL